MAGECFCRTLGIPVGEDLHEFWARADASDLDAIERRKYLDLRLTTGTTPVNIVVNGNVVGTNGMQELSQIVGQHLYDQQRGTGPTGGRQSMFSPNGGSF